MEFDEKAPSNNKTFCCVYNCDSKACRNRKLSFHLFPKKGVRNVTIENKFGQTEKIDINEAWMLRLQMDKQPSKFMRVCSLHFKASDYCAKDLGGYMKRYLKRNAVPSENLPESSLKEITQSRIRLLHEDDLNLERRGQEDDKEGIEPNQQLHLKCHICNKSYMKDYYLRVHLKQHTKKPKLHKCEICEKEFKLKQNFNRHKKIHKSEKKTFKCNLCDKVFKCNSSMHAHRIYFHLTEKKYQCGLCGEKFKVRRLLEKHFFSHKKKGELTENCRKHAESDCSESVCEFCHMDCSEEELEEHMTSYDVKPFKCECSGLFFSESEYTKHIKDDCEVVRNGFRHTEDYKLDNDVPFKEKKNSDLDAVKEESV